MSDAMPYIVGLGGLVAAAVAFYRARADKDATLATGAQALAQASAVLVEPLRAELVTTRAELGAVGLRLKTIEDAERECQKQLGALKATEHALHERIDALEIRLDRLKTGQQGVPGEQGVSGEQGVAGDTGRRGESGESGEQGVTGKQGVPGEQGRQGVTGEQGEPG